MDDDAPGRAKKKKTYYFNKEWETEFLFTNVKDKAVCLICGANIVVAKRHNAEGHFATTHKIVNGHYPAGTSLRKEKVSELKPTLSPAKKSQAATEASFRVAKELLRVVYETQKHSRMVQLSREQ